MVPHPVPRAARRSKRTPNSFSMYESGISVLNFTLKLFSFATVCQGDPSLWVNSEIANPDRWPYRSQIQAMNFLNSESSAPRSDGDGRDAWTSARGSAYARNF